MRFACKAQSWAWCEEGGTACGREGEPAWKPGISSTAISMCAQLTEITPVLLSPWKDEGGEGRGIRQIIGMPGVARHCAPSPFHQLIKALVPLETDAGGTGSCIPCLSRQDSEEKND